MKSLASKILERADKPFINEENFGEIDLAPFEKFNSSWTEFYSEVIKKAKNLKDKNGMSVIGNPNGSYIRADVWLADEFDEFQKDVKELSKYFSQAIKNFSIGYKMRKRKK